LGVVVHASNPRVRGWRQEDHPGLHSKTLSPKSKQTNKSIQRNGEMVQKLRIDILQLKILWSKAKKEKKKKTQKQKSYSALPLNREMALEPQCHAATCVQMAKIEIKERQ
jgi:hypothetical protein